MSFCVCVCILALKCIVSALREETGAIKKRINMILSSRGPICTCGPQCVFCIEVLANDSMRPYKLQCHIKTEHTNLVNKPVFERKRDDLQSQKSRIQLLGTINMKQGRL